MESIDHGTNGLCESIDTSSSNVVDKIQARRRWYEQSSKLITEGTARVKVLDTTSKWFGVTYAADRQGVVDKIQALVDAGEYPSKLF